MKQMTAKKALSRFMTLAFALAGLWVGLWLAPQSALATSVTSPPSDYPESGSGKSLTVALTITKSENGKAGIKGSEIAGETYKPADSGREYSINAIANDGYMFSHWSSSTHSDTKLAALLAEGVNSAENSFKMPRAPLTLTANFVKAEGVTVTTGDAPEIYSGYRNQKAAAVTVTEQASGVWSMEKDNIFTLTDKDGNPLDSVKISSVTFSNVANVAAGINGKTYACDAESGGLHSIGGAEIIIKDNTLTLKNFTQTATGGKKNAASFDMTLSLSAEAGFEGEVYVLSELTGVNSEYEPILIAMVVSPIEITTTTTVPQIGYQTVDAADITITEKAPGVLKSGAELYLTITDSTGQPSDIAFSAITMANNIEVGDASGLKLTITETSGARIGFKIDRASAGTPAVITLKGLSVKLDRSVPYGAYTLIAGGTAVAENYVASGELYDGFSTKGVAFKEYIALTTGNDAPGITPSVQITIGSNILKVGENNIEMDVAPFIEGGYTYVPVSFIALALGINETDIEWNSANNTVTINTGGRTIQFTVGSSVMLVNGLPTNTTGGGALIKDGRTFVPFRSLGDVLGVQVGWDDATRTATFN